MEILSTSRAGNLIDVVLFFTAAGVVTVYHELKKIAMRMLCCMSAGLCKPHSHAWMQIAVRFWCRICVEICMEKKLQLTFTDPQWPPVSVSVVRQSVCICHTIM